MNRDEERSSPASCRRRMCFTFPLHRDDRFSRSVQEPGLASRRLHAGCRPGSHQDIPPSLSRELGPPPVSTSSDPLRYVIDGLLARLS